MTTVSEIMYAIDGWVVSKGNGRWTNPGSPDVVTPIQAVRAETRQLVEMILLLEDRHSCLDIGLGDFGGSHVLWRMLFDHVVTIESDMAKLSRFNSGNIDFVRSPGCTLINYDSHHPECVRNVRTTSPYDLVHIDGDHTYEGVKQDYNNYAPMVRTSGLIVMHDLLLPGVLQFVQELESVGHVFRRIVWSTHVGLAVEVKK